MATIVSPLHEQQLDPPQKERLGAALTEMDQQLRKLMDTPWLCQSQEPGDDEVCSQGLATTPSFFFLGTSGLIYHSLHGTGMRPTLSAGCVAL